MADQPISIFGLLSQPTKEPKAPEATKTSNIMTADQAGAYYDKMNVMTADQAGAYYDKATAGHDDSKSFTGNLADQFFSTDLGKASKGIARIMSHTGQGAQQGWGAGSDFNGELKAWATKTGLSEFDEAHKSASKKFNEDFIRPSIYGALRFPATAVDVASHYAMGAFGGVMGFTGQVGEELQDAAEAANTSDNQSKWYLPFAPALGGTGEFFTLLTGGPFDIYHNPDTGEVKYGAPSMLLSEFLPHVTAVARAKGAIGEGEAGYFNAREPSPQALQERLSAAREAGIDPPKVNPPVTDVNLLARLIDPDAFKEWDHLREVQESLRKNLKGKTQALEDDLAFGRIQTPAELAKRDRDIQYLRDSFQSADERIRDLIPKTGDARTRVDELLNSDTPDGAMFRDFVQKILLENELKMAGLSTEVNLARSHARSLKPDPFNARPGELDADTHGLDKPGSSSAKIPEKILNDEPQIGHGMVRLYHGAEPGGDTAAGLGGARWATTSRTRARDYGKGNRDVYYVDLPQDHHLINTIKGDKENGIPGTQHINIPADVAKNLRSLKAQVVDAEGKLVPVEAPDKVSKPPGAGKVSGPARDLEQRAIEQGLADALEDKVEYTPAQKAEQATGVQAIMDDDFPRARRIALGSEEPPGNLLRVSFAKGIQERALSRGDLETVRRLANSDIFSEISTAGQTLSMWGNNLLDDPGAILNNIARTRSKRMDAATKKTLKDITKAWDTFTSSVEDFVNDIECK